MKLSEAIRLGSMLRPQISGFFFKDGRSCAQGAALEATGVPYSESTVFLDHHHQFSKQWPWTRDVVVPCPACGHTQFVKSLIAHLNNSRNVLDHGWTREAIADWIATIEPTDDQQPISEEVQEHETHLS